MWAEQAIRPAVVTRKVWGGNRTWAGAWTQQILASVLSTSRKQRHHPFPLLRRIYCAPEPIVISFDPGSTPPPR